MNAAPRPRPGARSRRSRRSGRRGRPSLAHAGRRDRAPGSPRAAAARGLAVRRRHLGLHRRHRWPRRAAPAGAARPDDRHRRPARRTISAARGRSCRSSSAAPATVPKASACSTCSTPTAPTSTGCTSPATRAARSPPAPPPGPGEARVLTPARGDARRGFAMTSSLHHDAALGARGLPRRRSAPTGCPRWPRRRGTLLDALPAGAPMPRPARAVFLGSGALKGVARESALKVLELTAGRTMTQWDSPLGYRHGPKAAVDDTTPRLRPAAPRPRHPPLRAATSPTRSARSFPTCR